MPALDKDSFDLWRVAHDSKIQIIIDHIQKQDEINLDNEGRISTLEQSKRSADVRVGIISSIIGAIFGGVAGGISVWK